MTDQNNAPFKADGPLADVMQAALDLPAETQGRQNLLRAIAKARADRAAPEGQVLVEALLHLRGLYDCADVVDAALASREAPPAAPTDNTALVERHANKQRNVIINRCSTDLETIINGHDPEIGNLNNDVWDRLDKMALEIEAALASRDAPPASDSGEKPLCPVCYNRTDAELRTIGGFYSMESNCPECSPRAKERAKQDADREALVRILQIITRNGSLDDGRTLHEVIADALLARGLRLPAPETMAWAVVGGDGQIKHVPGNGRNLAKQWAGPGDSINRVAIRVVEGGDDAA